MKNHLIRTYIIGVFLLFILTGMYTVLNAQSLAWQRAKTMGMGIDLSWLENYWNGTPSEGYRDYLDMHSLAGRKKDLELMHRLGFTTLRLPVAFNYWTTDKPPYKIIETGYFAAIDSILKWAEQYHLKVIIDNHNGSLDDSVKVMQALPRVEAIWRQIATRYKYTDPDEVFFELYNEPHYISDMQWKKCALQLIKVVHDIAPEHTIVIGGAGWNSIHGLIQLGTLPDSNIIYTFHFYDPFLFTHQGAAWAGVKATSNIHVPFPYNAATMPPVNPACTGTYGENNYKNYKQASSKAFLEKELLAAKDFSKKYNVPVFCGEWGSYKKYSDAQSRCRYTATIKKLLESLHIPFAYWEWDQSFSFFQGKPALQNISECMRKAWGFK
ncbi:MAG: glycoside hydrolase family 5 protein [Chitinophagaceae bacterium]|nr:MAG: glycoside hydrolase family 5 protein [Chitinophagaceae bacterium]